jgi:hypothetical protein
MVARIYKQVEYNPNEPFVTDPWDALVAMLPVDMRPVPLPDPSEDAVTEVFRAPVAPPVKGRRRVVFNGVFVRRA